MTVLKELRIPRMGSVENAKLIAWRIAEGATYGPGDVLYEIETDKTVTDVTADEAGVLARRLAEEGAELKVGDPVALGAAAGTAPAAITAMIEARARDAAPSESSAMAAAVHADIQRPLSPLVRRLLKEHGLDPRGIEGTGPEGRLTGDDVLRAAAGRRAPADGAPAIAGYEGVPCETVENSSRRRAISRRLAESARTSVNLTADMQVDMTNLLLRRSREADLAGGRASSVLAYVAAATVRLLSVHRTLNATYTDSHTLLWNVVNLGIGIDTPAGLVVPVIRDAGRLTVTQIDTEIADLARRARAGELAAKDLDGGTFTISNPGAIGPVLRAEAILNPPQVALLGLPGMVRAPLAIESSAGEFRVEVRPLLRPSLTFDHRALDGGPVIRFLNDLTAALEAK